MSTANGHGLVDPERRGKPVSLANKGRRVLVPKRAACSGLGLWGKVRCGLRAWGNTLVFGSQLSFFRGFTCCRPFPKDEELNYTPSAESKGNPVNIPEPEGWTECCWLAIFEGGEGSSLTLFRFSFLRKGEMRR